MKQILRFFGAATLLTSRGALSQIARWQNSPELRNQKTDESKITQYLKVDSNKDFSTELLPTPERKSQTREAQQVFENFLKDLEGKVLTKNYFRNT